MAIKSPLKRDCPFPVAPTAVTAAPHGGGESTGAVVASRALPTLVFAAGWNPESFLDEKADANAAQSRSSTAATLRQNQDLIGPGSAALLHASHEEPRYSGLLASFDEDMEDLIPSAEAGELPVQHWLHEEQKLSLEVGLGKGEDQYVHELPPSDLSGLQVEKTEPKGETAAGAISIFQWAAVCLREYLKESFGSWDVLLQQSCSSSNQLFPSFFLLNKQRQAALPDQRNRLPLPAQSAFIVYTLLTHLYKVYNQVPRPVQRAVASVAAFLNGKEMLLIPAAVVPMELYIHLAGDALPGLSEARGEAEEAEPRTSASDPTSAKAKKQRELAALLQSFSLRVLDSENPQSPLTAVDRMVLHELASRLLDDLADPLFRFGAAPDYIPPVRLIAEARQMSETVKHLTQQNGQGMVKAFSEIKGIASIQNKEAEVTKPHVEPPPSTRHPAASNHQEKPSESVDSKSLKEEEAEEESEERAAEKEETGRGEGTSSPQGVTTEELAHIKSEDSEVHDGYTEAHRLSNAPEKPLTLGGAARVDAAVATLKPTLENGKKSVQGGTALSKGPSTADDEREEAMEEQEESLQAQVAPRPSTHDGHQASNATEEQKKPLSLGGAMKIAAAVAAFKRRRTTRKGDEAKIKEQGKAVHQTEEEKEEQMTIESRSGQETAHKRHFDEIDETAVEAQEVGQEGKVRSLERAMSTGAHKKLSFRAAATVAAAAAALKRRLKTKNGTPQGQAEKGTNKETINETDETHGDINKKEATAGTEHEMHKEKQLCRGQKPLSPKEQFAAEFESLPPGNSRSSVLKKSAAVLRETEMRERGAAWTDSYHLLLDRIAQTTGNEEFSKSLKDQLLESNKLEAQLLRLSDAYTKEFPTNSKTEAHSVPLSAFIEAKKDRKREKELAHDAAQLLHQIAEQNLMGLRRLALWIECCNTNKDADKINRQEWGFDIAPNASMDKRLVSDKRSVRYMSWALTCRFGLRRTALGRACVKAAICALPTSLACGVLAAHITKGVAVNTSHHFLGELAVSLAGEVHKYGTWCLAIADFSDASICLMQRGFMELLFHDREGILSIPSSALSVSSFVTLLASSAAASSFVHMPLASRDTADTDARPHARSSSVHMHEDSNASTQNDHTQPKTLNEGEAAVGTTREAAEAKKQSSQRNKAATKTKKRKKKKKKQDKEGGNHEAQLSKQIEYALRQQVSLDEVHSYAYLVGGYYLSSAAASLPPPEREKQLDSLTSSFTALEKATSKEDKEKKAGVLAKLAVAAAVVPPHQYIWVLYAGKARKWQCRHKYVLWHGASL
ncbi:uncharacterized protein LOC34620453 [Cyclospora cayetanensis]|uniref:Uncharacterized protein LOC34620453 n=1 Tax=Cyclospora cayetanensis TaxID=88456 RepID=A0A6P6RSL5_9EIME|nr:uncharacterized protein LOC34620453 [Cyclospora cayetanensis]